MSQEAIIRSWKDPFSRENSTQNPAGNPFSELKEAQMDKLVGAGDMEAKMYFYIAWWRRCLYSNF
nr:plantaricin C family lantibiotic [Bacillus velezensis]